MAMLCWSRDIPVQETDTSYAEMKRIEDGLPQFNAKPVLLVWGMQDPSHPALDPTSLAAAIHTRHNT